MSQKKDFDYIDSNLNFFLNNVRFNTQVDYGYYNNIVKKFEVIIEDILSIDKLTLNNYKFTWRAGANGPFSSTDISIFKAAYFSEVDTEGENKVLEIIAEVPFILE